MGNERGLEWLQRTDLTRWKESSGRPTRVSLSKYLSSVRVTSWGYKFNTIQQPSGWVG